MICISLNGTVNKSDYKAIECGELLTKAVSKNTNVALKPRDLAEPFHSLLHQSMLYEMPGVVLSNSLNVSRPTSL